MKKYLNLLLLCAVVLSAFAPHALAAPVLTDWTSSTNGTSGSASGTLVVGGATVSVSFAGDVRDLQQGHTTVFNNATAGYSGQTVFTPSLAASDAIGTWGTAGVVNTITFSKPVSNPILWINSLGRGGNWPAATYVQTWTFSSPFTLLSSLNVPNVPNEPLNPYKMTKSGNSLIGQEGHGSIQFSGWVTSISWTSDKAEQSAYFQVGYDDTLQPAVYASGISPVTGWDPIFLNAPVVPDSLESKPVPTVGYNDPRWVNAHAATSFPVGSHPWEFIVPYNFSANWINAWANLNSNGHGKSTGISGWNVPSQSFTKYSTTVYGQGEFVLQFLADNASWIYVDGALVGYQDYDWGVNGTGRYLITLATPGAHDLGFVIWDGGGLAGGKFRLETRASWEANNPGVTLPPRAATVTLSNLTHTYDGTPKSATVSTAPGGLTTSVTYNGSSTPPTNAGSYTVVATVTTSGYLGSATGILTINKATATVTLGNLAQTYDGTLKSATATTTPANLSVAFTYNGTPLNAGTYGVLAIVNNSNYTATASGNLVISKANATVLVNGYTGVYDAAAHGATGSATGVGGVNLSAGLNLGATFIDAPGGTANWTFTGGTNYNDASGSAAIVIKKADATVLVNGYTGVYDAAAHGATGSATGVGGVNLSAGLNLGATFIDAPGGTANWTFTGGTNYNNASGAAVIAIAKANATVLVNGYTGVYDAAAHGATGSATGVGGVNLSAGLNLGAAFTDAPGGTANWTFTGGTNYYDASGSAAIVVKKADATVLVNGYTGIYDAAAHGATGTATGVGGVDLSAGLSLGATFTNAPGGTADWTFTGGTNYNDASGSAAIVLAKANATVLVIGYTGTYDAAAHGATGTATGVGGVDLSAGLSLGATFTNAPGGAADWTFTGGTNYNDASGSAAIVLAKANATVLVNGYSGIYDGAAHGATGSATGVGGVNLNAALSLGTTFTNAPGGTANWTFSGGTNYNDASGNAVVAIAKANATVRVLAYDVEYDGLEHSATVAAIEGVNGETGATVGSVTLNTTHTNVGTYSDFWSFAGGNNYNSISASVITNKIKDTTKPTLSLPANLTLEATSAAGAVSTFTASATDAVGVVSFITSAASGATFPIGTTTVNATAKDAAGNIATGSFTVTVRDTVKPTLTATMTPRGGGDDESAQFFTIVFSGTDLVGVKTLTATLNGVAVTSGQVVQLKTMKSGAQTVKRDDGKLQIKATSFLLTVVATDAAGNTTTTSVVPVFVKNGKDGDKKDDDKKDDDKKDYGKKDDGKKDN